MHITLTFFSSLHEHVAHSESSSASFVIISQPDRSLPIFRLIRIFSIASLRDCFINESLFYVNVALNAPKLTL